MVGEKLRTAMANKKAQAFIEFRKGSWINSNKTYWCKLCRRNLGVSLVDAVQHVEEYHHVTMKEGKVVVHRGLCITEKHFNELMETKRYTHRLGDRMLEIGFPRNYIYVAQEQSLAKFYSEKFTLDPDAVVPVLLTFEIPLSLLKVDIVTWCGLDFNYPTKDLEMIFGPAIRKYIKMYKSNSDKYGIFGDEPRVTTFTRDEYIELGWTNDNLSNCGHNYGATWPGSESIHTQVENDPDIVKLHWHRTLEELMTIQDIVELEPGFTSKSFYFHSEDLDQVTLISAVRVRRGY